MIGGRAKVVAFAARRVVTPNTGAIILSIVKNTPKGTANTASGVLAFDIIQMSMEGIRASRQLGVGQ